MDTPGHHYQRGLAALRAGDLPTAERAFARAEELDPHFAGGYVGQALLSMERQDFWQARQDVARALRTDGGFADALVALGRIVTAEGVSRGLATKAWLDEAVSAYRRALEKQPAALEAWYYQGQSYLAALDLPLARASLTKVVEANRGPWVAPAMETIGRIQMVELGAPGSAAGLKVALVPRLGRGELAVLLLEEMKLADLVRQRRPAAPVPGFAPPNAAPPAGRPPASDIAGSWARPWIEEILALGVPGLELYPDGSYQPDQPVRRADYALVNQGILVLITGDPALAARYVGEPSRFPDVRSDSYAYNAIALSSERGIMPADPITGRFRPDDPVSGAEALLIIRQLQNAVRMEF